MMTTVRVELEFEAVKSSWANIIDGLIWWKEMRVFRWRQQNNKENMGREEGKRRRNTEEGSDVDTFLLACR